MCGYLIIIKLIAKKRFSCKCYMNGLRMKMFTLIIYIIYGPFSDVMLSHDLRLDVGCDFTYATKAILATNVGYNYFIVAS